MSNSEKLDPLEHTRWSLQKLDHSSNKEIVSELKQLERDLANINQFKEEIEIFKEQILEKFGVLLEHNIERPQRLHKK